MNQADLDKLKSYVADGSMTQKTFDLVLKQDKRILSFDGREGNRYSFTINGGTNKLVIVSEPIHT